ncbi:MAG: alpha/beta fold hydrolase [Deltaproteobacteria bacterium]|nr:alpha/beta fold hydrolase [Deltaproteobacteria bacterium]MBP7286461.1 alpha/beta fold hydrolase [Nannocystaceae bacterium]
MAAMAGVLAAAIPCACASAASTDPVEAPGPAAAADTETADFEAARRRHPTVLLRPAPAPERRTLPAAPSGAERVRYPSGALELQAYFARPAGAAGPRPAVVYLHGGFSLVPSDFEHVRPLLDAGMVVMTPSLRGENGNPGELELLWGELDDAVAAIEWVARQPGVDPRRIHVVGHSIGGGLAALVSLRADADVASTTSIAGLYTPATFVRWAARDDDRQLVRFDPAVPSEGELRVLGPQLSRMVHPHVAYIGRDDAPFLDNAHALAAAAARVHAPLEIREVDGDHGGCVAPALADFLRRHAGEVTS